MPINKPSDTLCTYASIDRDDLEEHYLLMLQESTKSCEYFKHQHEHEKQERAEEVNFLKGQIENMKSRVEETLVLNENLEHLVRKLETEKEEQKKNHVKK